MSVTESETNADPVVTIPLADLGADVPPSVTVDVQSVPTGIEVTRREETFLVEGVLEAELTGVVGRDELPQCVPDWLEAVAELYGIDEVTLGR